MNKFFLLSLPQQAKGRNYITLLYAHIPEHDEMAYTHYVIRAARDNEGAWSFSLVIFIENKWQEIAGHLLLASIESDLKEWCKEQV